MPTARLRNGLMLLLFMAAAMGCVPAAAQTTGGFSTELDAAEKKLDADIKACRPINVNDYFTLQSQASANVRTAQKAQKAGLPVGVGQVASDVERATRLLERAQNAASKPCPPPQQQAQVPGGNANPPPPPPPPPPVQPQTTPQAAGGPHDILDELEQQTDEAVSNYWAAFRHCDKDGMKRAIDKLRDIADQVHDIHTAAKAAGKLGRFSQSDIDDMIDFEEDIDDFIYDSTFDVPKCPPPEQPKTQSAPGCPSTPSLPQLPKEPLLQEPLRYKLG